MKPRAPLLAYLSILVWGCAGSGAAGPAEGVAPPGTGIPQAPGSGAIPDSLTSRPVWEPTYGQGVRATVGTFPPFVGEVQAISGEVLLLREGTETFPLRLPSIRILEVRRSRRTRAVEGGITGAVLGALIGRATLIGVGGDHWETQGRILAPGLGAIMGGLLGALIGNRFGGDYWEEVTIPPNPRLDPRRVVDPRPLSDREEAAGTRAGGAGKEAP